MSEDEQEWSIEVFVYVKGRKHAIELAEEIFLAIVERPYKHADIKIRQENTQKPKITLPETAANNSK